MNLLKKNSFVVWQHCLPYFDCQCQVTKSNAQQIYLYFLSVLRSKANQDCSLVVFALLCFFYETTDIWRCKKFCCEIFLAFWVLWTLRAWMTGRLFSWDLHTSSGWGWRQLKSNIGFLVPTKNCPSEKFIYFRPKTQNQHTFKPTIKRILLYTLH